MEEINEIASPVVASLPHLITYLDSQLLRAIIHINGAKPGLWNVSPPYDEKDNYLPYRDDFKFESWSLSLNQADLIDLSAYSGGVIMNSPVIIVDCTADQKELAIADAERTELPGAEEGGAGYQHLSGLPKLLSKIGWVLIPVDHEHERALFVCSGAKAEYIRMLQRWCHAHGRYFATLTSNEGGLAMQVAPAPEETRRKLVHEQGAGFVMKMGLHGIAPEEALGYLIELQKNIQKQSPQ